MAEEWEYEEEWVDDLDWYSVLPRWSRWWKYGGGSEFRRNLRRSLKFNSFYEFRRYRRFMYKLRRKCDD